MNQAKVPIWSCEYIGYVNSASIISASEVYPFLKEARGAYLMNCRGDLFSDFNYENGFLQYKTYFQGDQIGLLQKEEIFFKSELFAQQLSAGRLTEPL